MINSKRRGRTPSLELVAGNGLINRRALLGQGIAIAGAMSTAGTMTGAAAEPLKDAPWSLEFGSTMPPVQIAVAVREGRRALAEQSERTNSATRTRARRIICSAAPSRRTGCTSRSITAACRTSTRPSTSS